MPTTWTPGQELGGAVWGTVKAQKDLGEGTTTTAKYCVLPRAYSCINSLINSNKLTWEYFYCQRITAANPLGARVRAEMRAHARTPHPVS